ncbi:MAG: hypothetical protein K2N05_10495 [Muribaculaceae bacterium]|nr:hypothetical protein [Muribaculaceae bacterium]
MKRISNIFGILIFLLLLIPQFVGCGSSVRTQQRMDRAEKMMETSPDSALAILDSISLGALSSRSEKARYAVLKSMALDKNFIDTITFDVLQPAIDYYLKKGTPDQKLRTLYYQGRIFENRKEDEEAMKCFLKANELKDVIADSIVLGRTYFAMSSLYYQQRRGEASAYYALLAANIYKDIDRTDLRADALLNALDGYNLLENREKLDSIIGLIHSLGEFDDPGNSFRHNQIVYGVEYFSGTELKNLLDSLQGFSSNDNIKLDMARAYSKLGIGKIAQTYFDSVKNIDGDVLKYMAIKTDVLEANGDYKGALDALKHYIAASDSMVSALLSQDVLFVEKKYNLEKINIYERQDRETLRNYSIICILFLIIVVILLYLRLRMVEIKKLKSEKEQLALTIRLNTISQENNRIELERKEALRENNILMTEVSTLSTEKEAYEKEHIRLKNEILELNVANEAVRMERDSIISDAEKVKDNLESLIAEREGLSEIIKRQSKIDSEFKDLVKDRLKILNAVMAAHLSASNKHLRQSNTLLQQTTKDKENFLISTKSIYYSLYPTFMTSLKEKGLTDLEMNYVCLYALGLKGNEIGEYLQTKRHYNISSEIRTKLGLAQNDTNLGLYILSQLK